MNMLTRLDLKYHRNVANAGRGAAMTAAIHELCDHIEALEAAIHELRLAAARKQT